MPARNPKYGNASDGYSANPATRRVRARVARLDPDQREAHRVYSREYTALWQATKRFARRDEYKSALIPERRRMLLKHLRGIIERRFVTIAFQALPTRISNEHQLTTFTYAAAKLARRSTESNQKLSSRTNSRRRLPSCDKMES
jgi:hypothetical protein